MRFHYMDTARAVCMLLGIPWHASLLYVVKDRAAGALANESYIVDFLGSLTTTFRMHSFFLIAGFFAALILSKRDWFIWLRGRGIALLIPLVAGSLLINPIILLARGIPFTELLNHPSFLIVHLWFLASLFWMCVMAGPLWALGVFNARIWSRVGKFSYLLVAALILWLYFVPEWVLHNAGHYPNHRLINISLIAKFLPFYVCGIFALQSEAVRAWLFNPSAIWAAVGLAAPVAYAVLKATPYEQILLAVASVFTTRVIIASFYHFASKASRWKRNLADKSFSIYLFHMPVIAVLGSIMTMVEWLPVIEFVIVCLVAFVISYALAVIVERLSITKLLFNGILPPSLRHLQSGGSAARPHA